MSKLKKGDLVNLKVEGIDHIGVYVRYMHTPFGMRHLIEFGNGQLIMKEICPTKRAPDKGGRRLVKNNLVIRPCG